MIRILKYFSIAVVALALISWTGQLLQISAGVVQSQKISVPPVANDALVFFGSTNVVGIDGDNFFSNKIISTDSDWDTVVCGLAHCLALKNGALYAWGLSTAGRTTFQASYSASLDNATIITNFPTQIGSDTDWTCISAGLSHSAAIRSGRLYTWGSNGNGQLGQGNTTNLNSLTQVGSDTNWSWVSCGENFTCAIKGGQLVCCGRNSSFVTGLNTSTGNTTSFTVANSGTTWGIVSCGSQHSLAIKGDSLFSWGANGSGRTGRGITAGSTQVPTQIGSLRDWAVVSAGNLNSFAIRNDSLYAFGSQQFGILGNGNLGFASITSPTLIGAGYTCVTSPNYNFNGITTTPASVAPSTSYAIRNDSLFATGWSGLGQYGFKTQFNAYATFQLIDSFNFNYKKISATSIGVIGIRGN